MTDSNNLTSVSNGEPQPSIEGFVDEVRVSIARDPDLVARTLAYVFVSLGASTEWSMDHNFCTTETIAILSRELFLPDASGPGAAEHEFYGRLALELGFRTDWEPNEDSEEEE